MNHVDTVNRSARVNKSFKRFKHGAGCVYDLVVNAGCESGTRAPSCGIQKVLQPANGKERVSILIKVDRICSKLILTHTCSMFDV